MRLSVKATTVSISSGLSGKQAGAQRGRGAGSERNAATAIGRGIPKGRLATLRRARGGFGAVLVAASLVACGEPVKQDARDAIVVGTVLPFSGKDATIAQNLEQAMLLAVEDVNRAGGVGGRRLVLRVRDSGSGSQRGLDSLLALLYDEGVRYLVGPEEYALANEIVTDIKGLDVLDVLPGYASPSIERVGRKGAWLRLPPSATVLGCGFSELAHQQQVDSANAIVVRGDFYQEVASEFFGEFNDAGGQLFPSVTVTVGASNYVDATNRTVGTGAERTLLLVDPTTASTIVTDWAVGAHQGGWMLGPTLKTPGFLPNVPLKSLDGARGLSPTLSLASECESRPAEYQGPIECRADNAETFSKYYSARWDGDHPFPAANFYYDAILLLAMGLQYELNAGNASPKAIDVREAIQELSADSSPFESWEALATILEKLGDGTKVALKGTAAEYRFDRYGAAVHTVLGSWRVEGLGYVDEINVHTRCALGSWR